MFEFNFICPDLLNEKLFQERTTVNFFCRVCLLVQDAYGMFGEVHLEGTIFKDRRLEGQSCRLAGMKVLQKATRGR